MPVADEDASSGTVALLLLAMLLLCAGAALLFFTLRRHSDDARWRQTLQRGSPRERTKSGRCTSPEPGTSTARGRLNRPSSARATAETQASKIRSGNGADAPAVFLDLEGDGEVQSAVFVPAEPRLRTASRLPKPAWIEEAEGLVKAFSDSNKRLKSLLDRGLGREEVGPTARGALQRRRTVGYGGDGEGVEQSMASWSPRQSWHSWQPTSRKAKSAGSEVEEAERSSYFTNDSGGNRVRSDSSENGSRPNAPEIASANDYNPRVVYPAGSPRLHSPGVYAASEDKEMPKGAHTAHPRPGSPPNAANRPPPPSFSDNVIRSSTARGVRPTVSSARAAGDARPLSAPARATSDDARPFSAPGRFHSTTMFTPVITRARASVTAGSTSVTVDDITGIHVGDHVTLHDSESESRMIRRVAADNGHRTGLVIVFLPFTMSYPKGTTVTVTSPFSQRIPSTSASSVFFSNCSGGEYMRPPSWNVEDPSTASENIATNSAGREQHFGVASSPETFEDEIRYRRFEAAENRRPETRRQRRAPNAADATRPGTVDFSPQAPSSEASSAWWQPWRRWKKGTAPGATRATSPEPDLSAARAASPPPEPQPHGVPTTERDSSWWQQRGCQKKAMTPEEATEAGLADVPRETQDARKLANALMADVQNQLEATRCFALSERKRAFRELQRQLHPDKNAHQEEAAKLAFQELMSQRQSYLRE